MEDPVKPAACLPLGCASTARGGVMKARAYKADDQALRRMPEDLARHVCRIAGHANATGTAVLRIRSGFDLTGALGQPCVTSARRRSPSAPDLRATSPCCIKGRRWWAVQGSNL